MSETTNLKLKKHDNVATNENPMNLEDYLNENWDIIDETFGTANNVIKDLQINVEDLNSENDKQNEDIETLKTDNDTNKENIETNASNIEKNTKDIELNTENIQTNTEDIETLKAQKEALEKELERQKEDNKLNGLTEDNEGELIHIDNSTGARFNSLEIEGNENQESQDGTSNLLVLEEGSKSQDGITVTVENGEVTISGTATASIHTICGKAYLHEGETYYIEKVGTSSNCGFRLQNQKNGAQQHWFATSGEVSFVAEATGEYDLYISTSSGQTPSTSNLKLRVSKESGIEWEQGFMNTPSFDYPSEIKTVGDNINVFNDEAYKGFVVTQQNYNSLEKIDLKLKNNKYYVAKIYFEDGTSVAVNNSNFMLYAYKADGTQSANIPNQIAKSYANATELVKAKIVANSTGLSTYANKVIKGIKIEEVADADGQPSPYSNYGQGCIKLKVVNKNFLDIQKNATVTKGGITVTTDENGVLTLNGTTTTNIYIKLNGKDIMDNNISNWKKSCFRKGIYKFTSEVLTTTQAGNINAFLRKDAYKTEGQYATLYQLMNAKTKTATANILEDTEAVVYLWIASGITLNNAKLKFQIELDNATDIVANEEQNDIIPVQQKMLSGDKFVKANGFWKEVHTWQEYAFDGTTEGFSMNWGEHVFGCTIKKFTNQNQTKEAYSNRFKFDTREALMTGLKDGYFAMQKNFDAIYFKDESCSTAEEFIAKVVALHEAGTPLKVVYKLNTPIELDCIPEQIEVLDKIEQEAHTYSEVTNVYTEDSVGAIIKTNTAVDLKTVINNIQEQLIAE